MGPEFAEEGVKDLMSAVRAMWKGKSFRPVLHREDAEVLDSAVQEGLSIITNDVRFAKNITRLGFLAEGF